MCSSLPNGCLEKATVSLVHDRWGGGEGGWTQGEKLDGKVSFKQSFSRTRSLIPQSKDWIGHPYDQSTDPRVYDVV